jgi:tetratricopeptide (TPR) repeat protein
LYNAVTMGLQYHLRVDDLRAHLTVARRRFQEDPDVLLASGALAELYASPRLAAGRAAGLAPTLPESLATAEDYYRRVLAVAPATDEARVRLARVLTLQGRCVAALDQLATPTRVSGALQFRYLAYLLAARASQCAGKHDDAAAAYEMATALCPECPTPRLGLATLSYPGSSRETAARHVDSALRALGPDPWWYYDFGQSSRLASEIERLRRAVRD